MLLLLLLLSILQPAPPPFTATWMGSSVARLAWSQPAGIAETCLIRNTTLITCWPNLPAGATVYRLGATGPLDASYRPMPNDVFTLTQDGAQFSAELRAVIFLPILR